MVVSGVKQMACCYTPDTATDKSKGFYICKSTRRCGTLLSLNDFTGSSFNVVRVAERPIHETRRCEFNDYCGKDLALAGEVEQSKAC